jgi:hypothetical protein
VYYFKVYDHQSGQMVCENKFGTREAIQRIPTAKTLEETAKEMDASQIDANGSLKKSQFSS